MLSYSLLMNLNVLLCLNQLQEGAWTERGY